MNSYFKVFSNCIPVKGANRSVICDLQRNVYHFIPNSLYDIILELDEVPIETLKKKYTNEKEEILNEYLEFLEQKELGFYCDSEELKLFPKIDLKWDYPAQITNAIIDVKKESNHDFNLLFKQLDELGCADIQIRIYDRFTLSEIKGILSSIGDLRIISVELLVENNIDISLDDYIQVGKAFPRLKKVHIYNSEKDEVVFSDGNTIIYTITNKVESSEHCGNICPASFNLSIDFFTEAQRHNTCLNRKMSIDINGEIKNCPAMSKSFGNISNTSLSKALENKDYKKYWFINKDEIEVCKDCEFRYICLDCRAFTEDSNTKYSKPSKCSYNPYTSKGFK